MKSRVSRRTALQAIAGFSAASLPAWFTETSITAQAAPLGPNDTPGIALIGCGGRGRGVANEAKAFGKMLAVCDVDDASLAQAKMMWPDVATYKDFRKLLERDDIHVIVNGTPDHWHTLVNMAAVKAGKDVYSEKPLTLTIDEGKRLKSFAIPRRSCKPAASNAATRTFGWPANWSATAASAPCSKSMSGCHMVGAKDRFLKSEVPPGLDWEMWLGQTPRVDYVANGVI